LCIQEILWGCDWWAGGVTVSEFEPVIWSERLPVTGKMVGAVVNNSREKWLGGEGCLGNLRGTLDSTSRLSQEPSPAGRASRPTVSEKKY
jgi:hypothetical protein